jgi:hypothetical protein
MWDNDGRCGYNEFSDAELIAYGFPYEYVYSYYSSVSYDWMSDSYYCPPGTVVYADYDSSPYCAIPQNVVVRKGQYHRAYTYTFDNPVSDLANYYYRFSSSGWGCNDVSGATAGSRVVSNSGVERDFQGISAGDTLTSCTGSGAQWPTITMTGGSLTGRTDGCLPGYKQVGSSCQYTYPAALSDGCEALEQRAQ